MTSSSLNNNNNSLIHNLCEIIKTRKLSGLYAGAQVEIIQHLVKVIVMVGYDWVKGRKLWK